MAVLADAASDRTRVPGTGERSKDVWAFVLMALTVVVFAGIATITVKKVSTFKSEDIISLVAALLTALISVVVATYGYLDRKAAAAERGEQRYEDIVLKSLEYFTGGTQRRSVGVAVVEGAWNNAPNLRPIFVSLLASQAIYLLDESKQEDAAHEQQNLSQIMDLLVRFERAGELSHSNQVGLASALHRKVPDVVSKRGVTVSAGDLDAWKGAFPKRT
ncbi:hypothetical protein J2X46_004113 [Nocardioides sp. BE266]|uniref:hypothetical protein n=1 Tax=Nocardioides sp. BE266 TaxID=2817725 RepID=UPI00285C34C9|nr:hypothetical protein [Nocardioides sp. BE266]MDR7255111.1 hypothetical protein [Nocardioides sp. BE266]